MNHLCEQCKRNEGEYVVIDYEHVLLLCSSCLEEYERMFGEIDTDSYHLKLGLYDFIKRVDEILKYLNEMNTRFSDRYFAIKKLGEEWVKAQPSPYDDATSDLPLSVRLVREHGRKLLEVIKW